MSNTIDNQPLNEKDGDTKSLLQFYVYVLVDPRDQNVFYVGKGQGNRVKQHVVDAQLNEDQETLGGPKGELIQQIQEAGHSPVELVVARFETEPEAFAVEATLIKWAYGFNNLTNLIQGRGSDCIRGKGDWTEIPHIDVPAPVRRNDGVFKDANLNRLKEVGAFDLLDQLTACLQDCGYDVRDFSLQSDRRYDPGQSNGWLGLLVRIGAVDFLLSFSHTCRIGISVANTGFSRDDFAQKQLNNMEVCMGEGYACGLPNNSLVKGAGRYRPIGLRPNFEPSSRPKFDGRDLTPLIERLGQISDCARKAEG